MGISPRDVFLRGLWGNVKLPKPPRPPLIASHPPPLTQAPCKPALAYASSLDTDRMRNARTPTSPRSTGFCAIWGCSSSSSSSDARGGPVPRAVEVRDRPRQAAADVVLVGGGPLVHLLLSPGPAPSGVYRRPCCPR